MSGTDSASVDLFGRLVESHQHLLCLEPSPQPDRPPLDPALLHEAMVFDQPLDSSASIA